MYLLMVSGDDSPMEQAKYPSLQKVRSFQKCIERKAANRFHRLIVVSCLSTLTIEDTDMFGL